MQDRTLSLTVAEAFADVWPTVDVAAIFEAVVGFAVFALERYGFEPLSTGG